MAHTPPDGIKTALGFMGCGSGGASGKFGSVQGMELKGTGSGSGGGHTKNANVVENGRNKCTTNVKMH